MTCKLTDQKLKSLTAGDVDADLGIALPGSSGKPEGKSGVKEELPSLAVIQTELKTHKRTYLLHT